MNVPKGVKYAALGFLFQLLNVNLNFGSVVINIIPEFVGWIFLFLACGLLADYLRNSTWMKPVALVLIVVTAALWVLDIAKIEVPYIGIVVGIITAIFMFVFFGALEKIAAEVESPRQSTLSTLKYLNLIVYILLVVAAVIISASGSHAFAAIFVLTGVVGLVAAIVTAVVLFKFSNEIQSRG